MSQSEAWTEPPWSGWIETTGDALLILEAARRGLIPRVTRRLVDSERRMICSGSVFVFDESESGIRRWTDGYYWSPSRILGNFLLYRETDKKNASQHRGTSVDLPKGEGLSRPKDAVLEGLEKQRERTLMGSLTNNFKFKNDGLMKKTFSVSINGVAQHLISYYKVSDVESGQLRSPSSLPELASLEISADYLDKTHFRTPPKVEIGADGVPRYVGEGDDIDTSGYMLPAPLSFGIPMFPESPPEKQRPTKRFEPYAASVPKRRKKVEEAPQAISSAILPPPSPLSSAAPAQVPSPIQLPTYPPYPPPPPSGYYQVPPGYPNPPMPPHMYLPYPHIPLPPSSTSTSTSPYPTPPPPPPPPPGSTQQPYYLPYYAHAYSNYPHPPAPPGSYAGYTNPPAPPSPPPQTKEQENGQTTAASS